MRDPAILKKEACRLAAKLLKTSDRYLENTLELTKIGEELKGSIWDTEFHIFGVIASDTDHLPLNKVRPHCSDTMLEKSDIELSEIIKSYESDIISACNEILTNHQNK